MSLGVSFLPGIPLDENMDQGTGEYCLLEMNIAFISCHVTRNQLISLQYHSHILKMFIMLYFISI